MATQLMQLSGNQIYAASKVGGVTTVEATPTLTFSGSRNLTVGGTLNVDSINAATMNIISITDVSGSQIEIANHGPNPTGPNSSAPNGGRRGDNKSTYGLVGLVAGDNEIATMFDVNAISSGAVTNTIIALSAEASRASTAESTLTANVASTVTSVSTEASRASTAESSLILNLSAEASRASTAESTLTANVASTVTSVSTEASRASTAESTLTANVASTVTSVSTEASRASTAESSLIFNLSAEASRASTAESSLIFNLSAEASRASTAESSLILNLSAEASRASTAEHNITYGTTQFRGVITFANDGDTVGSIKVNGAVEGGSFATTSDARLKTDIEDVVGGMDKVKALHPVFYNWISGVPGVNPGHKELGFLAQEVEAVLPNVVSTDASDEFHKKAVCYDRIVSLLVAAVKELDGRLAALEPRA